MTTQLLKNTGLVIALFGAAYAAEAQTTENTRPSKEEILAKYDADGDGVLSDTEKEAMRSEMKSQRGQRGQRGGQDGQSGQRQRPNREEIIAKYDADGDGVLSDAEKATMRAEMGERGQRGQRGQRGGKNSSAAMISKYDTDGNGELSAAELQQLLTDQESQSGMDQERGRRGGQAQEEGKGQSRQRMSREEIIAKYDTDGDGKLSETERAAMRADMKKSRDSSTTTATE